MRTREIKGMTLQKENRRWDRKKENQVKEKKKNVILTLRGIVQVLTCPGVEGNQRCNLYRSPDRSSWSGRKWWFLPASSESTRSPCCYCKAKSPELDWCYRSINPMLSSQREGGTIGYFSLVFIRFFFSLLVCVLFFFFFFCILDFWVLVICLSSLKFSLVI